MPAYLPPHARGRTRRPTTARTHVFAPEKSYHEYLQLMEERVAQGADAWIYDILDGRTERDAVIYEGPHYMIIKGPHHSAHNPHLLGIPRDKRLHSIRDIRATDIPMLTQMRAAMEQYIKTHQAAHRAIVAFFHYPPSTYHLHLHVGADKPARRNHYFDQVITNILQTPNYYRRAVHSNSKTKSKARTKTKSKSRTKSRTKSKARTKSKSRTKSRSERIYM